MDVHRLAVVQSLHHLFWHHTIFLPDIERVNERTSLCEVQIAVQADILLSLIFVGIAHYEHLGEILLAFAHTDQF